VTTALLWEIAEYVTFVPNSPEAASAYADTLGDLALGMLGGLVAAIATARLPARLPATLTGPLSSRMSSGAEPRSDEAEATSA
jgi:hypothetical protein